jgi:hypothetical protein
MKAEQGAKALVHEAHTVFQRYSQELADAKEQGRKKSRGEGSR